VGVACDGKGNIAVHDGTNGRVQVFRLRDGAHVRSIGSKGEGPGQFRNWGYVAFDAEGKLFVSDSWNDSVQVLEYSSGRHLRSIGRAGKGDGELTYCLGIALDCSGHLVVADYNNKRVQVFRCSDGQHVRTICPVDIEAAWGVAIDGEGRMLVCDDRGDCLHVLQ
jgi:tripartite motif-containing protein 2/3